MRRVNRNILLLGLCRWVLASGPESRRLLQSDLKDTDTLTEATGAKVVLLQRMRSAHYVLLALREAWSS